MIRHVTAKLLDLFHISIWERVVWKVDSHGEKLDWTNFPYVTFQVNQLDVLLVYILVYAGAVGWHLNVCQSSEESRDVPSVFNKTFVKASRKWKHVVQPENASALLFALVLGQECRTAASKRISFAAARPFWPLLWFVKAASSCLPGFVATKRTHNGYAILSLTDNALDCRAWIQLWGS